MHFFVSCVYKQDSENEIQCNLLLQTDSLLRPKEVYSAVKIIYYNFLLPKTQEKLQGGADDRLYQHYAAFFFEMLMEFTTCNFYSSLSVCSLMNDFCLGSLKTVPLCLLVVCTSKCTYVSSGENFFMFNLITTFFFVFYIFYTVFPCASFSSVAFINIDFIHFRGCKHKNTVLHACLPTVLKAALT